MTGVDDLVGIIMMIKGHIRASDQKLEDHHPDARMAGGPDRQLLTDMLSNHPDRVAGRGNRSGHIVLIFVLDNTAIRSLSIFQTGSLTSAGNLIRRRGSGRTSASTPTLLSAILEANVYGNFQMSDLDLAG